LTGADYILKITEGGESECLLGMEGIELPPQIQPFWILGDVFLRTVYSVFDIANKRVGLGQLAASTKTVVDELTHFSMGELPAFNGEVAIDELTKFSMGF